MPKERIAAVSLDSVLSNIGPHYSEYFGFRVAMGSQRYRLFKKRGITCAHCGLTGKFFALERHMPFERPHFNLYAIDPDGNEVLMTKDHIVPKSKGGKNWQSNYQVLCCRCNCKKGNKNEANGDAKGGDN